MNRTTGISDWTPLLVALLCIVAVGLAAATLTTATAPDREPREFGPEPIIGQGGGQVETGTNMGDPGQRASAVDLQICVEPLTSPIAVFGIVGAIGAIMFLVARFFTAAAGIITGLVLVPPVSISYFFLTNCAAGSGPSPGGGLPQGVGGLGGSGFLSNPLPSWAVMSIVVALVAIGGLVVFWSASGDEEYDPSEDESEDDVEMDAADIAAAAGEAADRIQAASVDINNEIYDAWAEMAAMLDVSSPESSTSGEFAQAAIDAGMSPDDVAELTGLFDDVRYGDVEPSEDRERRAVDILRRIESEYQRETDGNENDAE